MKTKNLDDRYAQTRLLLALWAMGALESAVNKSELMERVKRGKEKAGDYIPYLEILLGQGAIVLTDGAGKSIQKIARTGTGISLTELGKASLALGLADEGFQYEANVGCRIPNALLAWIRAEGSGVAREAIVPQISSYEEFKAVVIEIYHQLNQDHNLSNLVPIYQIRRAIKDQLHRTQFDEWLLETQSNGIFQFITGGVADLTPDKEKDSITTELGGLRYYAKLL